MQDCWRLTGRECCILLKHWKEKLGEGQLTRYDDKVLSFTDCTSFALLHERRLGEVFTFDGDFARVGFVERPST